MELSQSTWICSLLMQTWLRRTPLCNFRHCTLCADVCAEHVTLIPECQYGVPHEASANQCDRQHRQTLVYDPAQTAPRVTARTSFGHVHFGIIQLVLNAAAVSIGLWNTICLLQHNKLTTQQVREDTFRNFRRQTSWNITLFKLVVPCILCQCE